MYSSLLLGKKSCFFHNHHWLSYFSRFLTFIFKVTIISLTSGVNVLDFPSNTQFYFFYGPKNCQYQVFNLTNFTKIVQHPNYNQNHLTILFIHGMKESITIGSSPAIITAYGTRNDHNLIILNWSRIAGAGFSGIPKLIKVIMIFSKYFF